MVQEVTISGFTYWILDAGFLTRYICQTTNTTNEIPEIVKLEIVAADDQE